MTVYHNSYRPKEWEDVLGQGATVKALKALVESRGSQAFLLVGPSGTGKTTLARLSASKLGCCDPVEIDAASNNGIDAMREVLKVTQTRSLLSSSRAIIVDEAHRLSKPAWDAMLKSIEEPGEDVYWFFCTTEGSKVPETVRTRCTSFELKPVPERLIRSLLDNVCGSEGISVKEDILDLCAQDAKGSPRQALVSLSKAQSASSIEEARELLSRSAAPAEAVDVARFIFKEMFGEARKALLRLKGESPESIRIVIYQYAFSVARNTEGVFPLTVMSEFSAPAVEQNQLGDIYLRIERLRCKRKVGQSI